MAVRIALLVWLIFVTLLEIGLLVILTAAQWTMFALKKHRAAGLLSLIPIAVLVFNGPLESGLSRILRNMDEPDTAIHRAPASPSAPEAAPLSAEPDAE